MNLASISTLARSRIGAFNYFRCMNSSTRQAELGAQQQLAQQQLQQPLTAAQQYGSGVTSLIAGYPGSQFQQTSPSASPLQSALGLGSTLAGIYRAFG